MDVNSNGKLTLREFVDGVTINPIFINLLDGTYVQKCQQQQQQQRQQQRQQQQQLQQLQQQPGPSSRGEPGSTFLPSNVSF